MTHVAFFGDAERTFTLTPELVVELERKTGTGIGTLCQRVPEGHFKHADLVEIIRLSLVGGGTSPDEAKSLVDAYVAGRPLLDSYKLAAAILARLWAGEPAPDTQDAPTNG
ncbi:gene transfer agent family protein [Mesorhizobium marinum]|uniref:gene transfer agent family protein n=1 Tax=Mesorhizobium marinum TaxID=3228790 RepID=UPI003467BED1